MSPIIITISGPSLSGKTTLANYLKETLQTDIVTSLTTRPQRSNETEGVDYYFINAEQFKRLEQSNKLIQKTHFNEHYYGVSVDELKMKKMPLLWVVAPESVDQIQAYGQKHNIKVLSVFVYNPLEVLVKRIFDRFAADKNADSSNYTKRMLLLMNHEKVWIDQALDGSKKYDLIVDKFDAQNTVEILEKIKQLVAAPTIGNANKIRSKM